MDVLKEIANTVEKRSGIPTYEKSIDKILEAILSTSDVWKIVSLSEEPLPLVTEAIKVLKEKNYVKIDNGIFLTEKGRQLIRELKLEKLEDFRCRCCGGKGLDFNRFKNLYEEFLEIQKNRPEPIREYDQGYITPISTIARVMFATSKGDVKNKDIIDGGAYVGDSALIFYNYLQPRKIYALEPDSHNYSLLNKTIRFNKLDDIIIPLDHGVYNREGKLCFSGGSGGISRISESSNGEYIKVTTIDRLVYRYKIIPGLIKLDIEGYEKEALEGAIETLKKYKPVLLIAVYHTAKDFFEIPYLIKSVDNRYKLRFLNLKRTSPYSERFLLAYVDK